jgi:hypothetical protein
MWWRSSSLVLGPNWGTRRRRKPAAEQSQPAHRDFGAAGGRHRLRDNGIVPISGYRRYADILNARTREFPVVNTSKRPMFTPGQEQRAGIRDWLR